MRHLFQTCDHSNATFVPLYLVPGSLGMGLLTVLVCQTSTSSGLMTSNSAISRPIIFKKSSSSRPLLGGIRMGEPCERFLYKATLKANPAMSSMNFLPWSQWSYQPSTSCFSSPTPALTTGLDRPNVPTRPTGKTDTPRVYLGFFRRIF